MPPAGGTVVGAVPEYRMTAPLPTSVMVAVVARARSRVRAGSRCRGGAGGGCVAAASAYSSEETVNPIWSMRVGSVSRHGVLGQDRDVPAPQDARSRPPYVPVDGKPFRLVMGTRPLDLDDWIEVDEHRAAELREKDRLLRERHDEVVAHLPEGEAGSAEVLSLVLDHVTARFPELYDVTRDAEGRVVAVRDRQTGLVTEPGSLHPIDAAGRLVQEDLCLMTPVGMDTVLTAASLCFPSRWLLADKLGRSMLDIHVPVPGYETRLGAPADLFLNRLTVDRPVWRLNWTLLDDPALFQPSAADRARTHADLTAGDAGDLLFFRVERQTLRRLPRTGQVLFTIRTYVRPLRDVATSRPGVCADLAATLRTTSPEAVAYKGWAPILQPALDWLDAHS